MGCGGGDTTSSSSQGGGSATTSSSSGEGGHDDGGVAPAIYHHGDMVTIQGDLGSNDVTKTFLGGADGMIESMSPGQSMMSGNGWTFNMLGGPSSVKVDATRGKVLFTPEDSMNYNATRRFDSGFAIQEQRHFYKAHYVRNVMLLDGMPYQKSYQWKHERVSWENSVSDNDCEIKVYSWFAGGGGVITYVNRSTTDKSTYYGGKAADSNRDWALMEMMVFTGTQGQEDGKLITRVHKNGKTLISQNKQTERVYADPTGDCATSSSRTTSAISVRSRTAWTIPCLSRTCASSTRTIAASSSATRPRRAGNASSCATAWTSRAPPCARCKTG
ncbi:hypothetical protein E8A74_17735 [Polyangium fumosum]|uniref:Uncharacterized protein n=1 Tax=Polyangium fumosum TaxID=889272 RepID=A0A4U1JC06_9BACT|nr:hypothetical protein E8A74_17735 [Polyangium fumosum]